MQHEKRGRDVIRAASGECEQVNRKYRIKRAIPPSKVPDSGSGLHGLLFYGSNALSAIRILPYRSGQSQCL